MSSMLLPSMSRALASGDQAEFSTMVVRALRLLLWVMALVAAIGIVAKESLYWYTILVARRLRSEMLRANAWHHRSDAISSVVVLIGVGGAVMGYSYMDAIAAIVVATVVHAGGEPHAAQAFTNDKDRLLEAEKWMNQRQESDKQKINEQKLMKAVTEDDLDELISQGVTNHEISF